MITTHSTHIHLNNFREGQVLLINKPLHWTSFQLVNKVRHLLGHLHGKKPRIKVGHAGTLDPLASGLMIICTGKSTKQIEQYQGQSKTYEALLQFGETTPSYDKETEPNQTYGIEHITRESVEKTLQAFEGTQWQMPPVFSAKKVQGQRAYVKARKGESVAVQPRQITIHRLTLNDWSPPQARITVHCSKGTYIRSLAHDIGLHLQSGAHLAGLRRTFIGDYALNDALDINELEQKLIRPVTQ